MIYDKINEFCKVRNLGNCFSNGSEPTPRVKFLIGLIESEGIEYEIDVFEDDPIPVRDFDLGRFRRERMGRNPKTNRYYDDMFEDVEQIVEPAKNLYYNIIMKGTSDKMIIAHHDVNNHTIDNANDNSASCINVIAAKKLRPDVHAVIVDGEEFGGKGSRRLAAKIKSGDFGSISWVLNLELSGKGGKYFFIGNNPGPLYDRVRKMFDCPVASVPFNDSVNMRSAGIDSIVINPAPPMPKGKKSDLKFPMLGGEGVYLDFSIVFNCHRPTDTLASISSSDMKEFVEGVVLKIID
jgi:hypothetical protein